MSTPETERAHGSLPDPNLIYGLYSAGGFPSHVFRIALTLDVFSPLATGPLDAGAVADAIACDASGVRALLDYLTARELLARDGSRYALTETAQRFLVPGRASYAGEYILEHSSPAIWDGVLEALRGGTPRSPDLPWEQDAWLESYRPDRPAEARQMWQTAGIAPTAGLRILDVASGCGIKSLVLAEDNAGVRITLVDVAPVLEVARDLAERLGVGDQVEYLAGDALSVVLPPASYDVALLGQITYYLDAKANTELFTRAARALVPGGSLVIDAVMLGEEPSIWASTVTLLARGTSGGMAYPFDDYRTWLEAAGFEDVRYLGEHWVAARARA